MTMVRCQLASLAVALGVAACSKPPAPKPEQMPALPPLKLAPFLPTLKSLAAALQPPTDNTQKELQDLGAIALQLVDSDPRTQARAERGLLEHPRADWLLEPALQHNDANVRRRAAWLCGLSSQTVLQLPLLMRLKYEVDGETVVWVADALQKLGNEVGLAWLSAAMTSDRTAQQAGRIAIGICSERNISLTSEPTYAELQSSLNKLYADWQRTGRSPKDSLSAPDATQRDGRLASHLAAAEGTALRPVDDARYVLTRSGAMPVPLLVRTLTAEEPYLRTLALQILAELGPAAHAASPAVLPLLGDPLTGSYAARTLAEIGAAEAIPHLRARLNHEELELRAAAAQALGLLHDIDSATTLRGRLDDAGESMDVRVSAAFALLCFGPDAAAEAYLHERETKADYHAPTLKQLRDRLAALPR